MPDAATLNAPPVRTSRQRWAAPGSTHDRLVALARFILPVAIGILAAFLVLAPLFGTGDVSFLLDKNKVEVARERMKLQSAEYRGEDNKGQTFSLTAGSAVQRSSSEPIVQLRDLAASLSLANGPASVTARTGRYDMDSQIIQLFGPLNLKQGEGYQLETRDATVDLRGGTMTSGGAVTGRTPQGSFSANSVHADLDNRTVTLKGNARLRIVPARTR